MLQYLGTQEQSTKKRDEYQDLQLSSGDYGSKPVEIVPIIIQAKDTIPKTQKRNIEGLGTDVAPGLLQESVVLETAHIIRRVMTPKEVGRSPENPHYKVPACNSCDGGKK